jgi:pimeloyl-ACP methyl ester carboxylesterase
VSGLATGRSHAVTAIRHASGLAELGSHLGSELAAASQEVLATSLPRRWWTARIHAWALHGSVRLGLQGARHAASCGGRLVGAEPDPDGWLDLQSALNGVYGHLFASWRSAFALPMSLQRRARRIAKRRLVVFVHGLSMNERGWRSRAHERYCDWAHRYLEAGTAYLRYNTGLRISTNGRLLAELLEREASDVREIILVGHSMGGLVARSALHQGLERKLAWSKRVSRLACVGSPHEGTSIERLGNHANRMLGWSPLTRPFMRLGNLRSDGIRDLRFGHLIEEDWRHRHIDDPSPSATRVPLAPDVDHLHIAAARSRTGRLDPIGDWLVPVASALASNLHPEHSARRHLIRGIGHLALLGHGGVYERLRTWIRRSA